MATYFVRTDGSDSNTGLADDAAHAFLTIAHATSVATTAGDQVTVRAGTFDETTNPIKIAAGVTVRCAGKDITNIRSAVDAVVQSEACISFGDNALISGFTLTGTVAAGQFQSPIGSVAPNDGTYLNAIVRDAKIIADSDGVNNQAGTLSLLLERCDLVTKFDANTAALGVIVELRDCTITVTGPTATGSNNRACGAFVAQGKFTAKDTSFVIHMNLTSGGGVFGVDAVINSNSVASLINCSISTSNDNETPAPVDLAQGGSSKIYADSLTTYTTHSGTITTALAEMQPHKATVHRGDTVHFTYNNFTPDRVVAATHINFDNQITLDSFSIAGGSGTAKVPASAPFGDYSVKVGDGTSAYHVGTFTVTAPVSPGVLAGMIMLGLL